MGATPQRGGTTPGRTSVRDKLNINPEEALMEEYEAGYGAKQQQVRIFVAVTCVLIQPFKAYLCTWSCRSSWILHLPHLSLHILQVWGDVGV